MKTMILIFTILASILGFDDGKRNKYFEGEVIYTLEYEAYNYSFEKEKISEYTGSKIHMVSKEGSYIKHYYNDDEILLRTTVLDLENDLFFTIISDSDTLIWQNLSIKITDSKHKYIQDTIIENYQCRQIRTLSTTQPPIPNSSPLEREAFYYYSKDLKVKPNWYRSYKDYNYHRIMKKGRGVLIKSVEEGLFWTTITTIKSVKRRKVRKDEIKIDIPENLIWKKI